MGEKPYTLARAQFFKDGVVNRDPRPAPEVAVFKHGDKYTIKPTPKPRQGKVKI